MIPPRLAIALAGAFLGLLALIGAYFYGASVGRAQERTKTVTTLKRAQEALNKAENAWRVRDEAAVNQETQTRVVFREITREVPRIVSRPGYAGSCIDADGLQLMRRGVAAANGETPGGSDGNATDVR